MMHGRKNIKLLTREPTEPLNINEYQEYFFLVKAAGV